jgi:hypothetical protein
MCICLLFCTLNRHQTHTHYPCLITASPIVNTSQLLHILLITASPLATTSHTNAPVVTTSTIQCFYTLGAYSMAIQHHTPHRHSATPYLAFGQRNMATYPRYKRLYTYADYNSLPQKYIHTNISTYTNIHSHTVGRNIPNFYGQNTQ